MKKYTAKEVEEFIEGFYQYIKGLPFSDLIDGGGVQNFLKDKGITQQLEVGKWYKQQSPYNIGFFYIERLTDFGMVGYGLFNEKWFDKGTPWIDKNEQDYVYTELTDQEVETALIAEAKKRGFKEGARIKNHLGVNIGSAKGNAFVAGSESISCSSEFLLFIGNLLIFKKGQWATIIEEEEMTLKQVCKELGRDIKIIK